MQWLKVKLPKYASCWSALSVGGRIVGMPGMNVLSLSVPAQRDFLFRRRSSAAARICAKLVQLSVKLALCQTAESNEANIALITHGCRLLLINLYNIIGNISENRFKADNLQPKIIQLLCVTTYYKEMSLVSASIPIISFKLTQICRLLAILATIAHRHAKLGRRSSATAATNRRHGCRSLVLKLLQVASIFITVTAAVWCA